MRYYIYTFFVIIFFNCSQTKKKNDLSDSSKTGQAKQDLDSKKLNIDSLLLNKNNGYLLSFKNGELSLCCYDKIIETNIVNLKIFKKTTEKYKMEDGIKKVDVYVYGESFIKQFYNSDSQVNRLELVCGDLISNEIELSNGIQIGMAKLELFDKIFKRSNYIDSISILTVSENELGDFWTSYIFNDNKLIEIKFNGTIKGHDLQN